MRWEAGRSWPHRVSWTIAVLSREAESPPSACAAAAVSQDTPSHWWPSSPPPPRDVVEGRGGLWSVQSRLRRTGSHLPRPVRSGWILRQCCRGQSPRADGPAWPWSRDSKASLCLVISPPGCWIRWVLGIQETTRQTQTLPLGKADSRQVLGTSHSRQDSGADSCRAGLSVLVRTSFQAAAQVLMPAP